VVFVCGSTVDVKRWQNSSHALCMQSYYCTHDANSYVRYFIFPVGDTSHQVKLSSSGYDQGYSSKLEIYAITEKDGDRYQTG
jgi:hypothetical protein